MCLTSTLFLEVYPSLYTKCELVCFIIWGIDSSVFNDPLGEPGRTPLYVGLPSAWGSMDGDYMFYPHSVGGLLIGDSDRYK